MKITIVGTGFSGLATGWFFLNQFPDAEITFFDPLGIGGGTSGVAAGLLHPYVGATAKQNQYGLEGLALTKTLLEIASEQMGGPVARQEGFLRIAITDQQKKDFRFSSENYPGVIWMDADEIQGKIPGAVYQPGIFIQDCLTVDCALYLQGLWKACEKRGAKLEKKMVHSLEDLDEYDLIILATGAAVNKLLSTYPLPVTEVKGQVLTLKTPEQLPALPCPLNSQVYLILDQEKRICTVGATYERGFSSPLPDVNKASQEILPKACVMLPILQDAKILNCRAGVRASTPGHMPIVQQITPRCWVITGMGSKGLLYHAYYAKKLISSISDSFHQ